MVVAVLFEPVEKKENNRLSLGKINIDVLKRRHSIKKST
jgi:hypothetical protein